MARRILNRKDLRAQAEAAERAKDEDEDGDDEEEGDDDDDDEAEDGDEAKEEGGGDDDEEADEEEVKPKKKKAVKKAPAKTTKPRARTAKAQKMHYVWGVFNNSNQRVAVYPYKQKQDAQDHAARLSTDKKSGSPFFVQPVKEAMEEKKD